MSKKNLFWNTLNYPTDYPEKIRKIYYKHNLSIRRSFTEWSGKIGKKFHSDVDWWSTSVTSRNPYSSKLYHYICIVETVKELIKKKNILKISVDSKSLKNTISKIINIKNKEHVFLKKKNIFLKKKLDIFKSIIFTLFTYFYLNFFIKKKNITNEQEIILIDSFVFGKMKEGERLYKGLDLIVNKTNNIFFVPTFLPSRNLIELISAINLLKKKNYLFKEHFLKLNDLIYAFTHMFRIKKYFINYKFFKKNDFSNLIEEEMKQCNDYYSIISSILNYRFAQRLNEKKINLKKTIDWFENQTCDKGWNLGFRKFFPRIKTQGYQGYLFYGQYLNTFPSKSENIAKVIPKEIIVISKLFIKKKKEFFPSLKISTGPTFYFNDLGKKFKKTNKVNLLLILSGIYFLDNKLIDWISYSLRRNKNLHVTIKPHPILPFDKIKNNNLKQFNGHYNVSKEKLNLILKKTKIVISSGPTSGTLESIAYGCYLICPVLEPYDRLNLEIFKIPKNNYKLVYNKVDLSNEINKNYNKNFFLKRVNLFMEKSNSKNIYNFLNN